MEDKTIRHPDVWEISDAHFENAVKFVSYKLNFKVLGCIEEGRDDVLREYIDKEVFEYLEEILPEQKLWIQVMCFICGAAFAFAVKGGLSCERAAAVSTKYTEEVQVINKGEEFINLQKKMFIHFAEEVRHSRKIKSGHIAVDNAINYIENNVDTKIKVNEIAYYCGYSLSSLQHLFSSYMDMTLTDFIRKKKIEKACFLLTYTDLSCTKIAEKLSYSSQSYFINQFNKEKNMQPLQYRKKYHVYI